MNGIERLEELETKYSTLTVSSERDGTEYTEVDVEDLVFLIQNGFKQAERVQELEEELYGNNIQMGYKQMYSECNRDYAKLCRQNKRYRKALEFYAEGKHVAYKLDETDDDLVVDYGETARKALEGDEK